MIAVRSASTSRLSPALLIVFGGVFAMATLAAQQRDGAATPIARATATISGVVIDDQAGTPVRRAIVTLSGSGQPSTRSVVTDDDGSFSLRDVTPGRYTLIAAKAAFLESAYGATRPGRPGISLQISDRQQIAVSIRLARGAVIEGAIRDSDGRELAGITVSAFTLQMLDTVSLGSSAGREARTTTDDRGVYRFFGLMPGEYVVTAALPVIGEGEIVRLRDADTNAWLSQLERGTPSPAARGVERTSGGPALVYAATYYPGVSVFSQASRIRVGAGEERVGVDFSLVPTPTASMAGTVTRGDGQPLGRVQLSLIPDGPKSAGYSTSRPILSRPPGADGQFLYTSVPPGHYTILAATVAQNGSSAGPAPAGDRTMSPGPRRWFATAEVDAIGQDLLGIPLVLSPGVVVSGRVRFDAASSDAPKDLTAVQVRLAVPGGGYLASSRDGTMFGNAIVASSAINARADGTFVMTDVAPGLHQFLSSIPQDLTHRWWLRSAMLGDRDLVDEPLLVSTTNLTGIVLTFTDRRNELAGTLQTAGGRAAPEYIIVVVPDGTQSWHEGSRRFASARPGSDGQFGVKDLPAGSYRLAALTDFDRMDFADEDFLVRLRAQSIPVTIRDGERTLQAIQLAR